MSKINILILTVSLLLFANCSHTASGLAASSSPLESQSYKVLGHSKGESSYVSILGIIPTGTPDYDAAIADAIGKVPGGKTLINVRTYQTVIFLYLISVVALTVEGDVISY